MGRSSRQTSRTPIGQVSTDCARGGGVRPILSTPGPARGDTDTDVTFVAFQALNDNIAENNHMVGMGDQNAAAEAGRSENRSACESCGKTFSFQHDLARHIKHVHQKHESYICRKCNKAMSTSSNLSRHTKTCKGKVSPQGYQCMQCKKTFSSTTGLRKHCRNLS